MDNTVENNAVLDSAITKKIAEHYRHARAKHPYFADMMSYIKDPHHMDALLSGARSSLMCAIASRSVWTEQVLDCEVKEIYAAWAHGDDFHAVEECYDLIAVILRIVDMLEGRQKLGRPE